ATNYVQINGINGSQPADPPGANAVTHWSYTGIAAGNLTDGHKYQLQAQAADSAGNSSGWQPGSAFTFTYDLTAPTSTVVYPQVDLTPNTTMTYLTSPFTTISGGSQDNTSLTPTV